MNINKNSAYVAGSIMVFSGSLLIYLEDYRNFEWINIAGYLLIFLGWLMLFLQLSSTLSINNEKFFYKQDRAGGFKQRAAIFLTFIIVVATIIANTVGVSYLAGKRKDDILNNQPTQVTTAEVVGIEKRDGKNTTSYYAIFEYTVNGKVIRYYWNERQLGDFIVSQKYMIRYAVGYPEMFRLLNKVP